MARQPINTGTDANDGTGDTLRTAMQNINLNFDEIYASAIVNDFITVSGNEIRANRSNDDLVLEPSGTGKVTTPALTIDSNINITDNVISTLLSNSDLELTPAGTGSVVISKVDINDGAIDGTVIGATTPSAGTFTTVTATTSATIDGVVIQDNTISATSNADLELSSAGSGTVILNGLTFPTVDGSANDVLKTDGAGNIGFATASAQLNHSDINDNTTTVASSATSVIDTFSTATYRSAKYYISISDTTNGRYEIVEANVIHDGSDAYISSFGSTKNYDTVPTLSDLTVDVSGGDVRLLGTNISDNSCVFKFQRVVIDL